MYNVWTLQRSDVRRLADFFWKATLILFGVKFVSDVVASILYLYVVTEPGMKPHRWSVFDASISELSTAATIMFQLLAVRFAIEVGLRLIEERQP